MTCSSLDIVFIFPWLPLFIDCVPRILCTPMIPYAFINYFKSFLGGFGLAMGLPSTTRDCCLTLIADTTDSQVMTTWRENMQSMTEASGRLIVCTKTIVLEERVAALNIGNDGNHRNRTFWPNYFIFFLIWIESFNWK